MGIKFTEDHKFLFDFEHDGIDDIISLTGQGYQVEAFGKCFYYGYEFSDQVDGGVRSAFIKHVKFSENLQDNPDLTRFIQRAIDNLNKVVDLYDYDLVVMPESSSRVNQYMLRYIYRFAQPMLREMELIKSLPEKIYSNSLSESDKELCSRIHHQNVLVIDDITTSGSTLNEVLRALRVINDDNNISIFSLIGRRDLMVDVVMQ